MLVGTGVLDGPKYKRRHQGTASFFAPTSSKEKANDTYLLIYVRVNFFQKTHSSPIKALPFSKKLRYNGLIDSETWRKPYDMLLYGAP